MSDRPLRAYLVWPGSDPAFGGALVYDYTAQKARATAWRRVSWLSEAGEYTDVCAAWIRDPAIPPREDGPHAIDSDIPPEVVCRSCECWCPEGLPEDGRGLCEECAEWKEFGP